MPSSPSSLFSTNREDFSNQRILRITLCCFLIFSLMEGAAGIASGSLSLLGDAAAMLVDSFAYFMNLFAEKLKSGDGNLSCILGLDSGLGGYSIKRRLLFETVIPFISVCCLLIVALVVTYDAVRVLLSLDRGASMESVNPSDEESGAEVKFMFLFSAGGLLLDLGCALIFNARGSETFIEKKEVSNRIYKESIDDAFDWEADLDDSEFGDLDSHTEAAEFEDSLSGADKSLSSPSKSPDRKGESEGGFIHRMLQCICPSVLLKVDNSDLYKKNFNMIAAFTHVSADLIRTVSVLLAAIISHITGAAIQLCDAYAALVVIASIVGILIPLIRDMVGNTLKIMTEKDRPSSRSSLQMSSMAIN